MAVCSPTSTSQLPSPSKQTGPTLLPQQLQHHHCQSIYKQPSPQLNSLPPHFTFNRLLVFHLSQLIKQGLPILGSAAPQEAECLMMARFLMLFSPKTARLVCFPAPCHLAGVRGCHLLLLRQGRFSTQLPFHCSEHLLFVQAGTSLSFNVIAHASRKKPLREVQFYLESRSSHLGKL